VIERKLIQDFGYKKHLQYTDIPIQICDYGRLSNYRFSFSNVTATFFDS